MTTKVLSSRPRIKCGETKNAIIPLGGDAQHSLDYTISWLKLSDAGQYLCLHFIAAAVSDPNIKSSSIKNKTASIRAISKSMIKMYLTVNP